LFCGRSGKAVLSAPRTVRTVRNGLLPLKSPGMRPAFDKPVLKKARAASLHRYGRGTRFSPLDPVRPHASAVAAQVSETGTAPHISSYW